MDILIAIGHSGYERDQDIARGVPDIDLVVGGHSHSFLYSGMQLAAAKLRRTELSENPAT